MPTCPAPAALPTSSPAARTVVRGAREPGDIALADGRIVAIGNVAVTARVGLSELLLSGCTTAADGPDRRARHVIAGGREMVRDGEVPGLDLATARRELARRSQRLWP